MARERRSSDWGTRMVAPKSSAVSSRLNPSACSIKATSFACTRNHLQTAVTRVVTCTMALRSGMHIRKGFARSVRKKACGYLHVGFPTNSASAVMVAPTRMLPVWVMRK